MSLLQLLILWFVTAVSLFIISKLPTGVEIDDFKIALISSAYRSSSYPKCMSCFGNCPAIFYKIYYFLSEV